MMEYEMAFEDAIAEDDRILSAELVRLVVSNGPVVVVESDVLVVVA